MATATCHTKGCGNEDIPIPDVQHPINEDTGQPVDPWVIICGVCEQQITDVQE